MAGGWGPAKTHFRITPDTQYGATAEGYGYILCGQLRGNRTYSRLATTVNESDVTCYNCKRRIARKKQWNNSN